LLAIFALITIAGLSIWTALTYYAQVAVLLGKDSTLTGRTEIYRAAENPILQIWLDLGLIGVACLLLSLFQACRNIALCLVSNPSNYGQWCTMMIFLNLAALLGGDKIMFPHTIEWLLYVVGYLGLSSEAQRIREQQIA
jgi:hypothetical protein